MGVIYNQSLKDFQKVLGCTDQKMKKLGRRMSEAVIVTAIDFTNAFGSVPHDLIMATLKQWNFPRWVQMIIKDVYQGAILMIEMKGSRTQKIAWKRGVKQGCPLSPLLFNLCLEPLFQAVEKKCWECGAFVGQADEKIGFTVQAHVDDVIFISKEPKGIRKVLRILEQFVDWSQMKVNVKKCAIASYLIDKNRHRRSLAENLKFKGQDIPNLTLAQSLKYLGTAVAARQKVKLEAMKGKWTEMKIRRKKIMESPLLMAQKIDAIKTFVLPTLDFAMLNVDVGETQLSIIDKYTRGSIDEAMKVRGLPIECYHASW
jgi:hypothetical protein